MSKLHQADNHRVHQRRMFGVLAILAGVLTLAAIWNMPAEPGGMQTSPTI